MYTVPAHLVLRSDFASTLPELAIPWQAKHHDAPKLLQLNESLATELGLDADWLASEAGTRFLIGNAIAAGSRPVAQAYAGHQWGVYQPRLGDGRALLLGEVADADGDLWDIHLKGAGWTPFSRGGDGRAAVGPMLREYLIGEALHALGVPTTRALAVVATGDLISRDDSLAELPGAVLARVASSHLRVGTFQFARGTGDVELLRRLADHAISRHAPDAAAANDPYARLLSHVVVAQARLVAKWMLIGFVHGVMSTDNTSVSGETIDLGPCAFLDRYDPATTFSSIDANGRYAFGNQPGIALWNLTRFAEALLPLLDEDLERAKGIARERLAEFAPEHDRVWLSGLRAKFGLAHRSRDELSDEALLAFAAPALNDLQANAGDFTRFFRALGRAERGMDRELQSIFAANRGPGEWIDAWRALHPDARAMDLVNPVTIPRNHMVDAALNSAVDGDLGPFAKLLEAVTHPYDERPEFEEFGYPAPPELGPHVTYCGT